MKKILILTLTTITLAVTPVSATTKDLQLVNRFCRETYHKKPKIISQLNVTYYGLTHRKGRRYVYVIKFRSRSCGTYGYTQNGSYVRYNDFVPYGKRTITYYIYNPNSNYEDDVAARVGNNKIKVYLRKVRF